MKIDTENKTLIFAIGEGGIASMNHLLTRIVQDENTEFISLDSDKETLKKAKTKHKIQIGKTLVQGCSCYQNSFLGRACLYSNKRKVCNMLNGSSKIIILTTLGGGISSGATYALLEIAKNLGLSSSVIYTIPQDFEGKTRKNNTKETQKAIENLADKYFEVEYKPNTPISVNKLFLELNNRMVTACINVMKNV